ncbi:hypothetical protein [Halomarina litorea]|uniref:hypothetical protein n=1 Tax=Halomarina litorea TaxID=2961595 RepID=UPI0020C58CDF|nr:hypothetical protein [Halomarina sp. BCD28]
MSSRAIVTCTACGQAYAGRERADGSFILPTEDGECRCGETAVERFSMDGPTTSAT